MNAFGSYRQHQIIDFTQLKNESIFLITGPTGAGKTTIFDAICYSLYGKASGSERDQDAFRSHFSSQDEYTSVRLTFALKGGIYCVERSPKQLKRKTRGDGFTEEPASAAFYYQAEDKSWKLTATKINEVNESVEQLIGLDYEQFKKMMMIPQGEFRKLISENSREREEVLQKIFHTTFYRKMTERLKEHAHQLKEEIQFIDREIEQSFQHAELEESENPQIEDVQRAIEIENQNKVELEQKNNQLYNELQGLRAQYTEKKQLASYFKEYNERKQELQDLQEQKEHYLAWKQQLHIANQAEKVKPAALLYEERHQEWIEQKKAVAKITTDLESKRTSYEEAVRKYEEEKAKEAYREEKKLQWQKYQETAKKLKDYEAARLALETTEGQLTDVTAECSRLHEQLLTLEKKKEQHSEISTTIQTLVQAMEGKKHGITMLEQREESLEDLLQLKEEITDLEKELVHEQNKFNDLSQDYEVQAKKVSKLKQQQEQNYAIVLASHLESGQACPVCGSTHHPAVATADNHQELDTELEQETEKLAEKDEERQLLERRITQLSEQLRLKRDFAAKIAQKDDRDSSISVVQLNEILSEETSKKQQLLQQLETLTIEHNDKQMIQQKIADELQSFDNIKEQYDQLLQRKDRLNEEHREAEMKFIRLEAYLPKDFDSVEVFLHETESIKRQYEQLEQLWQQAKSDYEEKRSMFERLKVQLDQAAKYEIQLYERYSQQERIFQEQLTEHGFEDELNYRHALLDQVTKENLEKKIASYEETLQFIQKRMLALEELIKDQSEPNLALLEEQLQALEQQKDTIVREIQSVEMKMEKLESIKTQLLHLMERHEELSKKYYHFGELAEMARGDNAMRLSFERYVLSTFLDEILIQANLRLSQMTDHRYQLIRSQELAKRGAQSGLDLEVYDHYTGKQRSVKTLSGGEGFKASLSLALGMADIIQAHAGGVQLDMLFIDEGFGTLDDRSLEQAINCLKLLQENDRTLGIISHVPRLKEEIRTKLYVESTVDGSKAYFGY